jgi:hypothetical protein
MQPVARTEYWVICGSGAEGFGGARVRGERVNRTDDGVYVAGAIRWTRDNTLLVVIINSSGILKKRQVAVESRRLVKLLAQCRLGNTNVPEVIDGLYSCVECGAFEVISQRSVPAIHDFVAGAELLDKVGDEGQGGLPLPSVLTEFECDKERQDGTGSELGMCGFHVVIAEFLVNHLCFCGLVIGSNECLTLVGSQGV